MEGREFVVGRVESGWSNRLHNLLISMQSFNEFSETSGVITFNLAQSKEIVSEVLQTSNFKLQTSLAQSMANVPKTFQTSNFTLQTSK